MAKKEKEEVSCGLIMPISLIDSCSAEHWIEVKEIITEAIESITEFKFSVKLVSDADDSGVIHKRIVQNIYSSDIIVCDVSARNPNVMLELGMRLAFDKATVIVKDDKTEYSFDTGIIEHVPYPRDLHYQKIVNFKETLSTKVLATYKKSISNKDYSTFLKSLGEFQVVNLSETEVSPDKMMLQMFSELQSQIAVIRRQLDTKDLESSSGKKAKIVTLTDRFILHLLIDAIKKYCKTNNITDLSTLFNDSELYLFLNKEIEAGKYFDTNDEFKSKTRDALNYMRLIRL